MQAMRSLVALVAIASVEADIKDTLGKVCDLFSKMGKDQANLSPDEVKAVYGQFAHLFAETVDCSEDPFNPVIGFDEKQVSFEQCIAAKEKALKRKQVALQVNTMECIETIPDEADKTGAVWVEFTNTGKYVKEFTVRGAIRYHFDDAGKISAYHAVYDSYHILNKGSGIKDTLGKVCDLFSKMGKDNAKLTHEEVGAVYGQFAHLFAEKVDCSEDPFNPVIGFNEKGVAFPKCIEAKENALKDSQVKLEVDKMECIEIIADEVDNTGAVWVQLSNTGEFLEKFSVRGAIRYHFNNDGKIAAYHAVYDSYHVLGKPKDSRLNSVATISGLGESTLSSVALSAFAVVGTFALGVLLGRRNSKRYVALQDEELQQQ